MVAEMESDGRTADDDCAIISLPAENSLSPFVRDFLNENFRSAEDLAATPALLARLHSELKTDGDDFRRVQARVSATTARAVSHYDRLAHLLQKLASEIAQVRASTAPPASPEEDDGDEDVELWGAEERARAWAELEGAEMESILGSRGADGGGGGGDGRSKFDRRAMVAELETLAREVAHVERMRAYAESGLRLTQLVGDLEKLVDNLAKVTGRSGAFAQVGNAATALLITRAVQRMQRTEAAVADIAGERWSRFVSAVDLRVDRAAAIVRPAAVADHRGFLAGIGWPPPLSAGGAGDGKLANPLLDMSEDQERKYCQSFMALAILQAVQRGRRERQLREVGRSAVEDERASSTSSRASLWVMEELVNPIVAKAEPHLVRWTTKPEMVFALAYRTAQEYVDVVDEFLQPLMDKAKLAGFSAREEWVFSLAGMVSRYFQTHVLPGLANDVRDGGGGAGSVAAALWLHIVDQALAFDSRMKALAARALGLFQDGGGGAREEDQGDRAEDDLDGPVALSISAIADRPEWLALWAKVELEDALEKLRAELQTEAAWELRGGSSALSSLGLLRGEGPKVAGIGEFQAPAGADSVLASMFAVVDRCRSLSRPEQRYGFIMGGVVPIAQEYFQQLLRRCQEAEALTALADEASMVKVAVCVNAARYCERALQDWGEDLFFLELLVVKRRDSLSDAAELEGTIFDEEIESLRLWRQDWVGRLVSSLSRSFEARCREYIRNRKRWLDPGTGGGVGGFEPFQGMDPNRGDLLDEEHVNLLISFDVSASLVDSLAMLQSQLRSLRAALDNVSFFELWRNLAASLDPLLINSVVLGGSKFSDRGGGQFAADVRALFLVLKPYCARPSAFFKQLDDAVRLLTLPSRDALSLVRLLRAPSGDYPVDGLKQFGVRKLPPSVVAKILNARILPKL